MINNKINTIKTLGIISLCFLIFSVIFLFISAFFIPTETEVNWVYQAFSVLALILLLSLLIICTCASIIILKTDFQNKEINNYHRIIWGILSLVILGPIAILVFVSIVKNEKHNSYNNTEETNLKNTKNQGLTTIQNAFKMFEGGVITKEEFDVIKEKNLR